MTITFLDNRIADLRLVADSLLGESLDRDSKGFPGSEVHRQHIHAALFNIERAITELHEAKEGTHLAL